MRVTLAALTLAAVLLAGCGARVDDEASTAEDGYPVTVRNCGQEVTYDEPPRNVVAYDTGIIETLFALGLHDHIAGIVVGKGHERDLETSPWREDFDEVQRLGADRISKEVVLEAGADFVYAGWNYGFSEESGLTPQLLDDLGVHSYVLSESCRNGLSDTSRGTMDPLDALYTDIRNLGTIFGVPDRAEKLIARYEQTVADAEDRASDDEALSVFLYDSGTDKPLTGGRYAASHEIITRAGGDHVMDDVKDSWTTVTWESVVERDPDVIIINDYDQPDAAGKEKFLKQHPALADTSAVKHDRFLAMPYAALVQGPRNPDAVRTVADYLAKHR